MGLLLCTKVQGPYHQQMCKINAWCATIQKHLCHQNLPSYTSSTLSLHIEVGHLALLQFISSRWSGTPYSLTGPIHIRLVINPPKVPTGIQTRGHIMKFLQPQARIQAYQCQELSTSTSCPDQLCWGIRTETGCHWHHLDHHPVFN